MPTTPVCFLWGMPGSGKTTLGEKLSRKLGIDFIDLDHYIVAINHQSIAQLFEEGETFFRQKERAALEQLIEGRIASQKPVIIACGGGTPCFLDNATWMNSRGLTIYLEYPIGILIHRLTEKPTQERPLFQGLSAEELSQKTDSLFRQRQEIYQSAHITMVHPNRNIAALAEIISTRLT